MKSLKSVFLAAALIFVSVHGFSQLKLLPGNGLSGDLEKVIGDYPNNFQNITGELIRENPQSADYHSVIKPKGAEDCFISKFPSSKRNLYSWQARMGTVEDFDEAAKKFKSMYNQVNNLSVKLNGQTLRFTGAWQSPLEEKKFTSIVFETSPANGPVSKLKVELLMEYVLLEWKIKVLVYEREREDNERGDATD